MKAQLVLMSCILGGLSCSYSIHQVHCSGVDYPVPSGTGRPVEVVVEERVILGFAFDTEYVERAYIQLQEECPRGSLQAITTRYSTALSFLSWVETLRLEALCVETSSYPGARP